MANQSLNLPDLLAQYKAHEAAFPGLTGDAAETAWNEHASLLEHLIIQTRPASVACVASAIDFALEHYGESLAPCLLRHCAALLRAA
ncbi:hypothetical protein UFOVP62_46 [uncultured Caudovirales phage]|uniref:Uncharacterized protein n=1 Tax=uncultured Caudovirales phage TaxID=2100421 RepID=A0A6J5KRA7_9CAUD|nr:hypothetical protein UFOVP62_46 [uncultured Caudovirales phage]